MSDLVETVVSVSSVGNTPTLFENMENVGNSPILVQEIHHNLMNYELNLDDQE